jgi:hypothetical protein
MSACRNANSSSPGKRREGRRTMSFAEHRGDTAPPKRLAKDARGPQDPPRRRIERREARLDHPEHGLGQRTTTPLRHRAHDLLETERIAARPIHDLGDLLGRRRPAPQTPKGALDKPLGSPPRQRGEPDLLGASIRPEPREKIVHLRPREGEHDKGPIAELAQRRVKDLHRRGVAPVQILQHEQRGPRRGQTSNKLDVRGLDSIRHERGIPARGAQSRPALVSQRHAEHLAEELEDALFIARRDVLADEFGEFVAPRLRQLAGLERHRAPEGRCEHEEGGPCADRLAPAHADEHLGAAFVEPLEELLPQA